MEDGDEGESEEEKDEGEEDERQLEDFEDDEYHSDGTSHRRVNLLHENTTNGNFAVPYFPSAFSRSDDRPMEFNFELRLLDELRLRKPILSRDEEQNLALSPRHGEEDQSVSFESAQQAIDYCSQRLEEGWSVERRTATGRESRLEHPDLEKEALFAREGWALERALQTGQAHFDQNLGLVRLDR